MIQDRLLSESWTVHCTGAVQGVGFRPGVARLARRYGLDGLVTNVAGEVQIVVQGQRENLQSFVEALHSMPLPIRLDRVEITMALAGPHKRFEITDSTDTEGTRVNIPADQSICDQCIAELFDPLNRRYGYSQIACNSCGPRLTSLLSLPFDRERTTFVAFAPCLDCLSEYTDPDSRRFHGQLIACAKCGPRASLVGSDLRDDQIAACAAERIAAGEVGLIKGLAGVHMVCLADNDSAVRTLRLLKRRPVKPFAVMMGSVNSGRRCASVSKIAEKLLMSPERPIVVVPIRDKSTIADSVTFGLSTIGMLLPSSGFYAQVLRRLEEHHHILCGLICTSANTSGQNVPRALSKTEPHLVAGVSFQVDHDREILFPCDDSVYLDAEDSFVPARLGRGSTPMVINGGVAQASAIGLSFGPKANVCTMDEDFATLWPHAGAQLFNTREQFQELIRTVKNLSRHSPIVAGVDLAMSDTFVGWVRAEGWAIERVQHHHGHAVAVAIEHQLIPNPSLLGLICDGYGLGSDGVGWGGELIEFDFSAFRRKASVRAVNHPMGVDRRPRLLAHSFLQHAGIHKALRDVLVPLSAAECKVSTAVFDGRMPGAVGGSTGRLFDAVSALLGLSQSADYEGQPAILLEQLALTYLRNSPVVPNSFPRFAISEVGEDLILDERPFFCGIAPLVGTLPSAAIALWFHLVLADGLVELIVRTATSKDKIHAVVLAGGCMQNQILSSRLQFLLGRLGISCHKPVRIPANDGGLALGFARIAGFRNGAAATGY